MLKHYYDHLMPVQKIYSERKSNVSTRQSNDPSTESVPTSNLLSLHYHSSAVDLWALGITIVIGGQYFSWNLGYLAGYWSYLIAVLLISIGYITLCFCLSEITSTLPFAGGAYGLCRCTLGYTIGFAVGACQILEYIAYVAVAAYGFAQMLIGMFPSLDHLAYLLYFLVYASSLVVHIMGGKFFWRINLIIAVVSVIIEVIYIIGSCCVISKPIIPKDDVLYSVMNAHDFFKNLPLAAWLYIGVESLNFASDDVINPKVAIPKGQIACVLTLFVGAISVVFVGPPLASSLTEFAQTFLPFNLAFMEMFNIGPITATAFSLPATYATGFGFIFAYGRLIASMAGSKLFPQSWSKTNMVGAPHYALFAGSVLSFAGCFIIDAFPWTCTILFNICMLNAASSYIAKTLAYIALQLRYRNLSPVFRSPLGIPGAIICILIWSLVIIAICFFQDDNYAAIASFVIQCLLILIYYYLYAKKRQTFSDEENKVLLVAHVMNFNAHKQHKNHRHGVTSGTRTAASRETRTAHEYSNHTPKTSKASRISTRENNKVKPNEKLASMDKKISHEKDRSHLIGHL